jgi:hypothetical protein
MNFHVDVDITPEEMRRLVGLPDVASFQQEMLNQIRERMMAGVEGYDPLKLFQPYLSSAMASWEVFQKMFGVAFQAGTKPPGAGG